MSTASGERLGPHRDLVRGGLVLLAVTNPLAIATWGLAAPRSFFHRYPGAGHHWVSALPPYNEHLLRDFAAADLGLLVLLLGAAIFLERRLVQVALVAWAAAGLPHLAFHATETTQLSTLDNALSLGGLALSALLPLGLLALTRRPATPARTAG